MLHWYERTAFPIVGAGLVWIYGRLQGHGDGFQTFVRYLAALSFGVFTVIICHDLLDKIFDGFALMVGLGWSAIVIYFGWKKELA